MAVAQKTQKSAQQYKVGDIVEFVAYDGDADGELQAGDQLKVTGYDAEQELYNVTRISDDHEDSLFEAEFQPTSGKKAKKVAKPSDDEDDEEVAPAPKASKKAKKQVVEEVADEDDDEEEVEPVQKATKKGKKPTPVVDEDEDDEDEAEEPAPVTKKSPKKAAKAIDEDDEDVEEEPAPIAKKSTKKVVKAVEVDEDDEEEVVAVTKPSKKAKKVVEQDEDEDEAPVAKKVSKKNKADEDELPEFVQTASVSAAFKTYKGDALAAASGLAEEKEKTIFTLGGVLAYIKRNDTFGNIESDSGEALYEEGLKGFNAYVKDQLGVEARSAAYYVDLYEMFSQVTSEDKIAKIGWTKLRELLPLKASITEKNVDKWLKKAKEMTTKELHDAVTKELVDAGEKTHGNRQMAEQTTFKYVVHNDQANTITEAIARAKDIIGDDCTDGQALVHILSEWLDASDSE